MRKQWLAVVNENDIIVAHIGVKKNNTIKILFLDSIKPDENLTGGLPLSNDYYFRQIKHWFINKKIPYQKLKLAVSSLGLVTRVISLPQMPGSDLEKLVTNHIDQYFTINVNNYIIDYKIVNKYRENDRLMINVLLAALPKQRMEKIWSLCQYLGFEPEVIDLSADCIARIYSKLTLKTKISSDMAIISLYKDKIEFLLLDKGVFFLYSDMEIDIQAVENYLENNKLSNEISDENEEEVINDLLVVDDDPLDDIIYDEILESGLHAKAATSEDFFDLMKPMSFHEDTSFKQAALDTKQPTGNNNEFVLEDLFIPKEQVPLLNFTEEDMGYILDETEHSMESPDEFLDGFADEYLNKTPPDLVESTEKDIFDPLEFINLPGGLDETKKTMSFDNPKQQLEDYLHPVIVTLSELLSFYVARHFGKTVSNIYLTGEYCNLPHLAEIIEKNLGVKTEIGFPHGWKPQIKAKNKKLVAEWHKFGCLYGLALRED